MPQFSIHFFPPHCTHLHPFILSVSPLLLLSPFVFLFYTFITRTSPLFTSSLHVSTSSLHASISSIHASISSIHLHHRRMIMAARKFQKGQPGVRDKVMFAVSDFEEFSRDLEEFGVKKIPQGRDAILVTMRDASQKKYRMDLPFRCYGLYSAI